MNSLPSLKYQDQNFLVGFIMSRSVFTHRLVLLEDSDKL